jgi:hypothetical protein
MGLEERPQYSESDLEMAIINKAVDINISKNMKNNYVFMTDKK